MYSQAIFANPYARQPPVPFVSDSCLQADSTRSSGSYRTDIREINLKTAIGMAQKQLRHVEQAVEQFKRQTGVDRTDYTYRDFERIEQLTRDG